MYLLTLLIGEPDMQIFLLAISLVRVLKKNQMRYCMLVDYYLEADEMRAWNSLLALGRANL